MTKQQHDLMDNRIEIKRNFIQRYLNVGQYVNYDNLKKHKSFFLMFFLFIILYISNGHRSINLIRKITKVNNEVKKMKYEYLIYKNELTEIIQQGNLSIAMEKQGLKILKTPPIFLNDSLYQY